MGKVCAKCGRELKLSTYQEGDTMEAVVWSCPHCGPNVQMRDTEQVEAPQDEEEMVTMEMEEFARMAGEGLRQMEARIHDLRARIRSQEVMIQFLMGQPEKEPTRDALIDMVATWRARTESQDVRESGLREALSQVHLFVEDLKRQNDTLWNALRRLIEKMPEDALRAAPEPATVEGGPPCTLEEENQP